MTTEKPIKFTLDGKNYVYHFEGVRQSCNDCVFKDDDLGCGAMPDDCLYEGGIYKEAKE